MKIGIVGAGTMGNGIAHVFALYGYSVQLCDVNKAILTSAHDTICANMKRQQSKGIIDENKMQQSIDRLQFTTSISDLKECNLIVEAIKEDYKIKANLFSNLDQICGKNTILASNTSSISISKLAENVSFPERFIGMHFMNPVPIMKLIEIIKGKMTSKSTLGTIKKLSIAIEKIPVECNDSPGFVSNRILMPMINEAAYCYMEKVGDAESIDSIMKLGMGHPMGPLKLADLIGIDVCVYILNVLFEGFNDKKYKPCPLLVKMVSDNKLGKKTQEGFYKYGF